MLEFAHDFEILDANDKGRTVLLSSRFKEILQRELPTQAFINKQRP